MSGSTLTGLTPGAGTDLAVAPRDADPATRRARHRKDRPPLIVWIGTLALMTAVIGYGIDRHAAASRHLANTAREAARHIPVVQISVARVVADPLMLTLPGQTEAFDVTTIYARATGYVAERYVDIGSRVRKDDLLLKIASPELDQQLEQARARLQQAEAALTQAKALLDQANANAALAALTFGRANTLASRGFETMQTIDDQRTRVQSQRAMVETADAGIKVAVANIRAEQATVNRLATMTEFEMVRAPFAGVVTRRNVDVGDLVNADSKMGNPLFALAKDKILRVNVRVPQADAGAIDQGVKATVTLPRDPTLTLSGSVARSSAALLDSGRTLDTEVDVDNAAGRVRAGSFVTVTLEIPRRKPAVSLPSDALIFNANGLQVAVVEHGEVTLHTVDIYRDLGKSVELAGGLDGGEHVVRNPPIDLADHAKVEVAQ